MAQSETHRQALQLLEGLYDGVASPERWGLALRDAGEALGGQYAAVISHHMPSDTLVIDDAGSLLPEIEQGFSAMSDIDPARAAVPLMMAGGVYVDHEFHGAASLLRKPFYADFLHGHGVGHYALVPSAVDEEYFHVMSVQRELGRGAFSGDEVMLMRTVQAHLRHVLQLRRQLRQQQAQTLLLQGALNALGFPILICSMRGHVVSANATGQQWLRQPSCLLATAEHLPAPARRVLEQACGHAVPTPRTAAWQQPDGDLMIALPFAPVSAAASEALALVVIQGLRWRNAVPDTLLRSLFGLTPAEIRLVHHLMQHDEPLTVIAGQMHLSLNTLRTQLKAIFQKTHTSRQSDLLRLMGQLGLVRSPAIAGG